MNTLTDELSIELEDFGFPTSAAPSSVAIRVDEMILLLILLHPAEDRNFTPESVTVDGEKLVITLGDMDTGDGVDYDITDGSRIYVVIRQSAGVSNPTEAGTFGPVIEFGDRGGPRFRGTYST